MNTKSSEISSELVAVAWMNPDEDMSDEAFSWATDTSTGHVLAVVRLSDAEAIINDLQTLVIAENQRKQQLEAEVAAKDAEIERLKQTPTIEDAKTTVEHLRAYAADNGYSHGDYADVMTEAANQIEKQSERIKELEAEVLEQCRINGMGAERELALLGQIERQSAALKLAREAFVAITKVESGTVTTSYDMRRIALATIDALGEAI